MSKEYLEALECLERIYANVDTNADYYFVEVNEDYNTVEQTLLKAQEQEKVLSIIFEKGLPLPEKDIIKQSKDYNEYCIKWSWLGRTANIAIQKTEEEFNLLKRCMSNE